jgi:DNA repair ATPase RecN
MIKRSTSRIAKSKAIVTDKIIVKIELKSFGSNYLKKMSKNLTENIKLHSRYHSVLDSFVESKSWIVTMI